MKKNVRLDAQNFQIYKNALVFAQKTQKYTKTSA